MIAYLIDLVAASAEMDFILQLDLIGMSFSQDVLSHISPSTGIARQSCTTYVCPTVTTFFYFDLAT